MDYEKNYKEALERAEQLYAEDCSAEAKDACEYIFPELAENEDERIRKELLIDIPKVFPYEKANRYIAYLEKQKEQKPAEWSEEDEKMRRLLVAILEVNHPNGFFKANDLGDGNMRVVHTEVITAWLKSLRPQPHWKPSEEQMEALDFVLCHYAFLVNGVRKGLVSLYDDLKKL